MTSGAISHISKSILLSFLLQEEKRINTDTKQNNILFLICQNKEVFRSNAKILLILLKNLLPVFRIFVGTVCLF
jgi:hypothetical protein